MAISDETLMAYVDGELTDVERAALEASLAQDETLRARLEAHQRLRTKLSAAFDGALDEPVPARLRLAAEPPHTSAPVIDLAARRARLWSMREWGAMAASVAAGLVLGVGIVGRPAPMIAAESGALVARGALAQALETQLASDEAGAVRIGLSFRAEDGAYCRTFDLTQAGTSGLACRIHDGWAVAMTAANPASEVRTAGAAAEVLAAVEARMAGDPLDANAEAQARSEGWR
jgi:anti-sigma-K factor RskA